MGSFRAIFAVIAIVLLAGSAFAVDYLDFIISECNAARPGAPCNAWWAQSLPNPPVYYETALGNYTNLNITNIGNRSVLPSDPIEVKVNYRIDGSAWQTGPPMPHTWVPAPGASYLANGPLNIICDASHIGMHTIDVVVDPSNQWVERPPNGESNNNWTFTYECRHSPNLRASIDDTPAMHGDPWYWGNNTVTWSVHNDGLVDAPASVTRVMYGTTSWSYSTGDATATFLMDVPTPPIAAGGSWSQTMEMPFCDAANQGNVVIYADWPNSILETDEHDNDAYVTNIATPCTCAPNGNACNANSDCCSAVCDSVTFLCGGDIDLVAVSANTVPPSPLPLMVPRGAKYTAGPSPVLYGVNITVNSTAGPAHVLYSPASGYPLVSAEFSTAPGIWAAEGRASYYSGTTWTGRAATPLALNCSNIGLQSLHIVIDPGNDYSETDEANNEIFIPFNCTAPEVSVLPGSVTMLPAAPAAGENVTVSATILQRGGGGFESGFPIVKFNASWGENYTVNVAPISAGYGAGTFAKTLNCPSAGPKSITIIADPNNLYTPEPSEANNTYVLTFNCAAQVIDLVSYAFVPLPELSVGYPVSYRIRTRSASATIANTTVTRVEWEGMNYSHTITAPVAPNTIIEYAQSITCTSPGNKTLRVYADALNSLYETPPSGETNNVWNMTIECKNFSMADCIGKPVYPGCGAQPSTWLDCHDYSYTTPVGFADYACFQYTPPASGICSRSGREMPWGYGNGMCVQFDAAHQSDCASVPGCYVDGSGNCKSVCQGISTQAACNANSNCTWYSSVCEMALTHCPSSATPYACLKLDCRCANDGESCYSNSDCCGTNATCIYNPAGAVSGKCLSMPDYVAEVADPAGFVHATGSAFTIYATTRNVGGAGAAIASNSKFRSNLNGGPDEIVNIAVPGLAAGASSAPYSISLTCPSSPSRTPLNLSADNSSASGASQIAESIESNNVANYTLFCCRASGSSCALPSDCCENSCVGGVCAQPSDLVPIISEANPVPHMVGSDFNATVRVANNGIGNAAATVTNVSFGATEFDISTPAIAGGATSPNATEVFTCGAIGTFPLFARADKNAAVIESDEANNLQYINVACTCIPSGTSCTNSGDCCSGLSCGQDPSNPSNSICRVCTAIGNACANEAECCAGHCAGGTCRMCNYAGGPCTTDANCCDGTCSGGSCAARVDVVPQVVLTSPVAPYDANQQFSGTFRILNNGPDPTAGSHAEVVFASGSPLVVSIPPIAGNGYQDFNVDFRCPPASGTYTVAVRADSQNEIPEAPSPDAEANNLVTYTIACNAVASCGGMICSFGGSDWEAIAWIAFLIAVIFLALSYMASKMIQQPGLEAWVRIEMGEIFVSLVIIVFVLGLVGGVNSLLQLLTGEPNYQTAAMDYLTNFRDGAGDLYNRLAEVSFRINKVVGFSFSGGMSALVVSYTHSMAPRSGMGALLSSVNNAMDSLSLTILFIEAQRLFLIFFGAVATITFPLGLVLRTFPLTRKIGAVLLAAAISTAVVYPVGLVFSKQIYQAYSPPIYRNVYHLPDAVPDIGTPPLVQLYCDPLLQKFTSCLGLGEVCYEIAICVPVCSAIAAACTVGFAGCFASCYPVCTKIVDIAYYVATAGFSAYMTIPLSSYATKFDPNLYFDAVNLYALPAVTDMIVLATILSLIPIIAAVVLMRNLTTVFGGDAQLYGLYKIL